MQRALNRVAHHHPASLGTRDTALDHDQTAFDVDLGNFHILCRDKNLSHVTGHLLVLERATRILAVAGRTVRPVRDRNAVRCLEAAEIVTLHHARKALAHGDARDIDHLTRHEVIGGDEITDSHHVFGTDAKLGQLALWLDLRLREMSTIRFGLTFDLCKAGAELDRLVSERLGAFAAAIKAAKVDDGADDEPLREDPDDEH